MSLFLILTTSAQGMAGYLSCIPFGISCRSLADDLHQAGEPELQQPCVVEVTSRLAVDERHRFTGRLQHVTKAKPLWRDILVLCLFQHLVPKPGAEKAASIQVHLASQQFGQLALDSRQPDEPH